MINRILKYFFISVLLILPLNVFASEIEDYYKSVDIILQQKSGRYFCGQCFFLMDKDENVFFYDYGCYSKDKRIYTNIADLIKTNSCMYKPL